MQELSAAAETNPADASAANPWDKQIQNRRTGSAASSRASAIGSLEQRWAQTVDPAVEKAKTASEAITAVTAVTASCQQAQAPPPQTHQNLKRQKEALAPVPEEAQRAYLPPASAGPYDAKTSVGSARYVSPYTPGSSDPTSPRRGVLLSPLQASPRLGLGQTKTERWRESGFPRWPRHADDELRMQPSQFKRSEEMVPLQRGKPTQGEEGGGVGAELFVRSLRSKGGLRLQDLGMHNQNLGTVNAAKAFDRNGLGWTGATNSKKHGEHRPATTDWITRPVAVGNMSLGHMGGTRYCMNLSPRTCVPNSMGHLPTNS